jgi:hypothetical protein
LILDTFIARPGSDAFEEAVSVAASFACTLPTQESLLDLLFVGPQAFCFTAGRGLAHTEHLRWSTVSWILRWARSRSWKTAVERRRVNVTYPYFGLCLLAACVGRPESDWSYVGLGVLVIGALWRLRSPRFALPVWAGVAMVALAMGFLGNRGLEQLYGYLQNYSPDWLTARVQGRFEARESRTSIGSLGPLKLSGRIVLRVESKDDRAPPALLREASYSAYRSPTWYGAGTDKDLQPIAPEADETTWTLLPPRPNEGGVNIAGTLPGGRGLLPLANGTIRLENLPASALQTNRLGAVRVEAGPGFVMFDDYFGSGPGMDSAPTADDLQLPETEAAALVQVGAELSLDARQPAATLKALAAFFQERFTYTLRLAPPTRSQTDQTPWAPSCSDIARGIANTSPPPRSCCCDRRDSPRPTL